MFTNLLHYLCMPYMYYKYIKGKRALVAALPVPDNEGKGRRFTRIEEVEEALATLRAKETLTDAEKLWQRTLMDHRSNAHVGYDKRPVFRLPGADAQVEKFADFFSAWKMRGLKKNYTKRMRPVKLNYYPDNAPPAFREQMVSLGTAIQSEHDDVEYPLPMTPWEETLPGNATSTSTSTSTSDKSRVKALADKYFQDQGKK